jgi:cleavage stimulation factor subunit 1
MLAKSIQDGISTDTSAQSVENHPVIRTLYDHADEITTLDFHPFEPILASGSRD